MTENKLPLISDWDNFYFTLAVFAVVLAGNLVWWEVKQATYDFEQQASLVYPVVSDPDKRDIIRQNRDIAAANAQLQEELDALELEMNAE